MKINSKNPAYVIGFAGLTAAIFTAAIMALHVATADIVERNQRLLREKALVEIFQLGDVEKLSGLDIDGIVQKQIDETQIITDPQTQRQFKLILAFDRDKNAPDAELVGYGFKISGIGFWARIDGVMALNCDLSRIKGIAFLQHSETPGLGGRITEKPWRKKFRSLNASEPAEGAKFIYVGGSAPASASDERYNRHVDGISGATGTSTALGEFLETDIRSFRRAAVAAGLVKVN